MKSSMIQNTSNQAYNNMFKMVGNTPYNKSQNTDTKQSLASTSIASVNVGNINENEEQTNKKKIFGIIGLSVGSAALLTLVGLLTLSKGFSSGFYKKVKTFSDSLQKKIYDLSTSSKELSNSEKIKLKMSKVIQPVAETLQASSNISAIKDAGLLKILKKLHLNSFVEKVNPFFKNIVLKTKNEAYSNAEIANIKLCNYIKELAQKNNDIELKSLIESIENNYTKSFSTPVHFNRTEGYWGKMSNLHEEVSNILFSKEGVLKKGNRKKLHSYITLDLIEKDRNSLKQFLANSKSKISNNIIDVYQSQKQALNELKVNLKTDDLKAVEFIQKISDNFEASKKLSGVHEKELRNKLHQEISEVLKELNKYLSSDPKYKDNIATLTKNIQNLENSISPAKTQKGLTQEAISKIKHKYGKDSKEYKQASILARDLNEKLNKAIDYEFNTLEKMAELQVGSAPSDIILGMVAPTGLAAYLIAKSKDKDERISRTLTQGIPIIGGIAVSYYGTTRMFTGAKNLLLGLGTGYLLNVVGAKTDELYKQYRDKQLAFKKAFDMFNTTQTKTYEKV